MAHARILLLFAGLILLQRLHTWHEPINRDLGDYATIAHEMHFGKSLYSDLPDQKPPGVHVSYYVAEAVAGYGPGAIGLLGVTAALATLIGAWAAVLLLTGNHRAALWAGAFWTIIAGDLFTEANQPNAEVFMNAFTMAGLAFMALSFRQGAAWRPILAAGFCFALATLYKQVIVTVPVCVGLAWVISPPPGRSRWRAFAEVLVIGGIIAGAWGATLGYFAIDGRLGAFWHWVITYNRRYAGNLGANLADLVPNLFPSCLLAMLPLTSLVVIGIASALRHGFPKAPEGENGESGGMPVPTPERPEGVDEACSRLTPDSAPTARQQTSLGQRPRAPVAEAPRAEGPTQFLVRLGRAFSPDALRSKILGRCPRLVWGRAFGPEKPKAVLRTNTADRQIEAPQPDTLQPSYKGRLRTDGLTGTLLLILLAIGTMLAIALPGRFSPHYYQLWFPWLITGGGCAIAAIETTWNRRVAVWTGAVTLTLLGAFQFPNYLLSPEEWSNLKYNRLFIETNHIGRQIKTLLKPGETFFALADEAELYPVSGLRPPTRFLGIAGFTYPTEGQSLRIQAVDELKAAKPDLILADMISLLLLQKVGDAEILPYVSANYRPVGREFIRFTYLVRKGSDLDQRFAKGTAHIPPPL